MCYNKFAVLKTAGCGGGLRGVSQRNSRAAIMRYRACRGMGRSKRLSAFLSLTERIFYFWTANSYNIKKEDLIMPSESVLAQKQKFVADLAEKLKNAAGGVLVDYKGISVEEDTKLRKELRENGVEYLVVKNTLLKRAAEAAGIDGLESALSGTTAIAISNEDIIIAPKLLNKKAEASNGTFAVKLGFVDGKVITKEEVLAYAKLPSKETLLSQLVFMLQSPIQRLAIAISEIEKKQNEETA